MVTECCPPGVFYVKSTGIASVTFGITDETQSFFPALARTSAFSLVVERHESDCALSVGGRGPKQVKGVAKAAIQRLPLYIKSEEDVTSVFA